jgi:phosphate/phosphite/phosphonate ABC transporter binding protein
MLEGRHVFGLATQGRPTAELETLLAWVSERANTLLVHEATASYEALADKMGDGEVDIAWLPPLVFVRLEGMGLVAPLVTNLRAGRSSYQSVIVVPADAPAKCLEDLRGKRAAWVDPLSAAGYVLPHGHIQAEVGDPKAFFGEERFWGSHTAALEALRKGEADVAATYGAAGTDERLQQQSLDPSLRVLATFGGIPADVIAARVGLAQDLRLRVANAFVLAGEDDAMRPVARSVFGVEAFCVGSAASYAGLHPSLRAALASGLLRAVDKAKG